MLDERVALEENKVGTSSSVLSGVSFVYTCGAVARLSLMTTFTTIALVISRKVS